MRQLTCVAILAIGLVGTPAVGGGEIPSVEAGRLRTHLRALDHPRASVADQARASAYISRQLLRMGYEVTLSPIGNSENIIARLPGRTMPERRIIVGAHFDTVPDSPGADDNTSGIAGMLEVARVLAESKPDKTIEFIAFALEEVGLIGSRSHAQGAKAMGDTIDGVLVLEMIGFTCDTPGCQFAFGDAPPCLDVEPEGVDTGTFVGVVGNAASAALVDAFVESSAGAAPDLDVVKAVVAGNGECFGDTRRSDHSAYWDAGFPAVMITDTSNFRNPNYHKPTDVLDTLDVDFMQKVATAAAATARRLASAGADVESESE